MLSRPQLVLIDVDGTLVDSVPDLHFCVNAMLEQLGMPPHSEAMVRTWVGNGVERLVRRSLIGRLDGEPDDALFQRAYPIYLKLYENNVSARSRLYPGVKEGLAWLKANKFNVGCVTNKAAQFTEPLLKDLGIFGEFGIVVSGDTLPRKKPDPAPLLHVARHFGVAPAKSLMIGDSVSDVTAARAAGFGIVCMSYGYNHGQDIRTAHPDAVIDSMAEFPNVIGLDG
jgi:phosphoglycolate phosphatase